MSVGELATAILILCGKGGADKDFDCYDYYNNCVISKNVEPTMDNLDKCKDNYSEGIKRIRKLKEEK